MTTTHLTPAEFRKRVAKHVLEADVQSAILDWLAILKVRAVRIETAGQPVYGPLGAIAGLKTCSHVGTPDILVWLPWGQACAIEVKRAGEGKTGLRFSQARWIIETAKLSPLTILIVPESLADVEKVIEPLLVHWACDRSKPNPIGRFWGFRLTGGCPELSQPIIDAREHAVELSRLRLAKGPQ